MTQPPVQPPFPPPAGPSARTGVRADDRERDATAERLGDALADGALSAAEYQARLDRALGAATRDELDALTADLPESRSAAVRAAAHAATERRLADRLRWRKEIGYWAGGAVIMNVLWAAGSLSSGRAEDYWPAWPLGIWGAILLSYVFWPERDKKDRAP
ncbi:DUF1707 SHOCT-like domain-containing protein [Actinomadura rupiterrae]|uniref:DUF1707 SHOCT-like domain-containing protein n=1 Tax=Actinomadura rupiterrae TaxID=559627 RepID=UPI0020A3F8C5|nr:DUF1707 domain-containing protein [Actinomadura rupiterrae]MCP2343275.1 hypothetical protein [Actinomadura rupiterrae]